MIGHEHTENGNESGITEDVIYNVLKECYDPEIPVDIVNLGLVYGVTIVDAWVGVKMTLTTPGCGAADWIADSVKKRVLEVPGVKEADVRLVWQPAWNPGMMSNEARKKLLITK